MFNLPKILVLLSAVLLSLIGSPASAQAHSRPILSSSLYNAYSTHQADEVRVVFNRDVSLDRVARAVSLALDRVRPNQSFTASTYQVEGVLHAINTGRPVLETRPVRYVCDRYVDDDGHHHPRRDSRDPGRCYDRYVAAHLPHHAKVVADISIEVSIQQLADAAAVQPVPVSSSTASAPTPTSTPAVAATIPSSPPAGAPAAEAARPRAERVLELPSARSAPAVPVQSITAAHPSQSGSSRWIMAFIVIAVVVGGAFFLRWLLRSGQQVPRAGPPVERADSQADTGPINVPDWHAPVYSRAEVDGYVKAWTAREERLVEEHRALVAEITERERKIAELEAALRRQTTPEVRENREQYMQQADDLIRRRDEKIAELTYTIDRLQQERDQHAKRGDQLDGLRNVALQHEVTLSKKSLKHLFEMEAGLRQLFGASTHDEVFLAAHRARESAVLLEAYAVRAAELERLQRKIQTGLPSPHDPELARLVEKRKREFGTLIHEIAQHDPNGHPRNTMLSAPPPPVASQPVATQDVWTPLPPQGPPPGTRELSPSGGWYPQPGDQSTRPTVDNRDSARALAAALNGTNAGVEHLRSVPPGPPKRTTEPRQPPPPPPEALVSKRDRGTFPGTGPNGSDSRPEEPLPPPPRVPTNIGMDIHALGQLVSESLPPPPPTTPTGGSSDQRPSSPRAEDEDDRGLNEAFGTPP